MARLNIRNWALTLSRLGYSLFNEFSPNPYNTFCYHSIGPYIIGLLVVVYLWQLQIVILFIPSLCSLYNVYITPSQKLCINTTPFHFNNSTRGCFNNSVTAQVCLHSIGLLATALSEQCVHPIRRTTCTKACLRAGAVSRIVYLCVSIVNALQVCFEPWSYYPSGVRRNRHLNKYRFIWAHQIWAHQIWRIILEIADTSSQPLCTIWGLLHTIHQ